ncbi:MAG: hypothetical protein ABSF81_00305 [Bacteroidales bacterium]
MKFKYRKIILFSAIVLPLVFAGCKKTDNPIINPPKDTTPPAIEIYSPVENQVYKSKKVLFSGLIKDPNFNKAEYSTDNGQTKKPLEESWSDSLSVENGNQKVIVYASDIYNNSSTSTVDFSVNYTAPPVDKTPPKIAVASPLENKVYDTDVVHFQGNITDENFSEASYSLNGVENPGLPQSWSEDKTLANGNYRYIVKAKDKAGNSSADTVDFTVDKHSWKYAVNPFSQPDSITKPIIWNNFTTPDQRNAYLDDKLYNFDKTDTLTGIPGQFVCTDFASLLATDFNGYPELGFDPAKGLQNNQLYNTPMYTITLMKPVTFHQIDGVMIEDNVTNITDWRFLEPQTDSTYSLSKFNDMGVYKIVINFTRVLDTETQGKVLDEISMLEFIPDGNGGWKDSGYRNPGIKLKEER